MRDWYGLSKQDVLRLLNTSEQGLRQTEAQARRETYGENRLKEEARKSIWMVFLEQFQDLLVVILLIAALISLFSDNVESTIVIFAVLILNAVLGTVQHHKAEKTLDSLKSLSAPSAYVLRDGRKMEIPSAEVVPGDIMLLEAGDLVTADGRVIEAHLFMVNESSLTGESEPVEKQNRVLNRQDIPLADRRNIVFSGSLVTGGRAVVVVTATGMETELGKIAALMNNTKEKKTPLQISLDDFSQKLAAAIMVICALVFILSLYRKMPILDSLMFAVALAVAAIPEALGSIVTIVQAMGTQKMARENAIIKDLKAVESLGCVSIICSDKTGTLTQNRMTAQQVYADGWFWKVGQLNAFHPVHRMLLYGSILANDAVVGNQELIGDPTETALLEMGQNIGMSIQTLRAQMPRHGEIPFDSTRKLMSTVHIVDGERVLFTKGAIDVLLDRADQIAGSRGVRTMSQSDRQTIMNQSLECSRQGLRVLAVAYRDAKELSGCGIADERDYTFLGFVAMMDPPRPESRSAVVSAKRAGIKPVMITGDHKITATAIAEKISLFDPGDLAITGQELDQMSDRELDQALGRISVYARVSPEHKIRIVDAWQRRGHIVAMTGDGVNDAPALKKADIGVAMGIAGTEVSKDAASMILTDDNFATIIKAVTNGRNVYRNIRHAIQFLLSGNMAGIFCVLYTSLLALPMPFAPVHLLFINLLTDSLPAIAIGMEPQEEGLLDQPPRDPDEGILTSRFMTAISVQGALISLCTMLAYHTGLETGGAGVASSMAFATLTLARLLHGFNCRSKHSIVELGLRSNLWSVMAFEAGVLLLGSVLFLPGLQVLFAVADLSIRQLITIVVFALIPTAVIQAWKTLREAVQ